MAHSLSDKAAKDELRYLGQALFGGSSNELKHVALYHHAIDLMTVIHDNRNERLDSSDGTVRALARAARGCADHARLPVIFRDVESRGADTDDRVARGADRLCCDCARLSVHRGRADLTRAL